MMRTLSAVGLLALALASTGCLIRREITDVIAHDDINSFKVQTMSGYWGFAVGWIEWDVWNCYRTAEGYRCHEVDYEMAQQGFRPVGALPSISPPAGETGADEEDEETGAEPTPEPTGDDAASADDSRPGGEGETCRDDTDCGDGLVCKEGACNP